MPSSRVETLVALIAAFFLFGCTPETYPVFVDRPVHPPQKPAVLFSSGEQPTPPVKPEEWTKESIEQWDIDATNYIADYKEWARDICTKLRGLSIREGHPFNTRCLRSEATGDFE